MGGKSRTAERIIAAIASCANGIVARAELLPAGVTAREIERRLQKGLLIREYTGVYRVGHRAPNPLATYSAAVKAGGPGAVLAGLAAAWVLGLLKGAAPPPEIITRTPRTIEGVLTRCCKRLDPLHTSTHEQIPITTVPRTIIDLAPRMRPEQLARLFHEAVVRYGTRPEHVERLLTGRPGAGKLRAVMYGDTPVLLSRAEERMFELIDEAKLPRPTYNKRRGNRFLDLYWPGLHVEIDSYRFHSSRHAWASDTVRRRETAKARDMYLPFTADEVFDQPKMVIAELRAALARV